MSENEVRRFVDKAGERRRVYEPVPGIYVAKIKYSGEKHTLRVIRCPGSCQVLEDNPEVESFAPVFKDEEGREVLIVPDEVAVQFRENTGSARIREILSMLRLEVSGDYRDECLFSVKATDRRDVFHIIEELNSLSEVEIAAPMHWGLDHREAYSEVPLENTRAYSALEVLKAWDMVGRGSPAVRVAIIDGGIDVDHPALRNSIPPMPESADWDFSSVGISPDEDDYSHGSKVAGIVTGSIAGDHCLGIAPGCGLIPLKVSLQEADVLQRVDALKYIAKNCSELGIKVVNCSWHVGTDDPFVKRAMKQVVDAGVLIVSSAGNLGFDFPHYPSDYEFVLSVSALKRSGEKWPRANYGKGVNICAPGTRIGTAAPKGFYTHGTGTSYAAAIVSGCAALIWSRYPDSTPAEVANRIISTASSIKEQNPGFDEDLGAGCINLLKALQ